MENIIFDSGMRSFRINDGGVLRFNPSDPNVYARFMDAVEKIKNVESEQAEKANLIDRNAATAPEEILHIMSETDKKIKAILNDVFGNGNDFDALLEGVNLMAVASNGERVVSNLIDALLPIMESGAKACVQSETNDAKLNREQRRALQ